MTATTNVAQSPKQKGISKKTFRIIVLILLLLLIVIFALSYFMGFNPLKPVINSPLNLTQGAPTYIFSIYGEGVDGQLKKPMGVTVANRDIYVTDTTNRRVQVFDYNGKYLFRWGKEGKEKGDFQFPYGIAADADSNIYVADMWAGNIQEFSSEGQFIKYFAEDKPESDLIGKPAGIFFADGKLYVADLMTNSIKVFTVADGKKVLEFGKRGKKDGEFEAPNGVSIANNQIFVSDTQNDRVQVFDMEGNFLFKFNGSVSNGKNPKTSIPRGIGVDGRGVVYTASLLGNYVTGFDTKGKFLWTFGAQGVEDGQFYLPNGLFVDDQGRIYITDQGNNRVSVWEN